MSHTSTIESIRFMDIDAVEMAVNELREKHGVRLRFERNLKPRAYYPDQEGMTEPAPYCIVVEDAKYDIGLYPAADGQGYEARYDTFDYPVEAGIRHYIGAEVEQQDSAELGYSANDQAAAGKLYNLYSIHATMRRAFALGYSDVQRVETPDGRTQVHVGLAA